MFASKVKLTPVAIDPGSSTLKMLQLAIEDGACRVVAAAQRALPGALRRADERDEALAELISCTWREGSFKGKDVVCAVPSTGLRFKSFRLPQMPQDEIEEVARFEAQERFALDDLDAEYRFILAGDVRQGQDLREEVIAMACPGESLTRLLAMVDRQGLNCRAIDVGACCMVRSQEWKGDGDGKQVRAYAELGQHSTRLAIARQGNVLFIKSIDVGGARFNELVAQGLNMPPAEAHDLHRRLCRACDDDADSCKPDVRAAVREAMQPAVEQLAKEIGLCMRYYAVTFRGARPDVLTCLGGQSHDQGLLEALSASAGMRMSRGAPFKHIDTAGVFSGAERQGQLPEWAAAVGLALRDIAVPQVQEVTP